MLSLKFAIPSGSLEDLASFLEEFEIHDCSIFENPEMGLSDKLDDNGFSVPKCYDVEIFVDSLDVANNIHESLLKKFNDTIKNMEICEIEDKDWVDVYIRALKPVVLKKFYIYNDKLMDPPSNQDWIPIKIRSSLAFGTGHHHTTQACILNALFLEGIGFTPKIVLDMGCGTGILGICSYKIWDDLYIIGVDIDPEAVNISNKNFKINKIAGDAKVLHDLSILSEDSIDLIFCNILKQPLLDLASQFYRVLKCDGYIITSGYLKSQECEIVEHYKRNSFMITKLIYMDDWISILFRKI
jgi:ribosomal protein L11 methyltransferase